MEILASTVRVLERTVPTWLKKLCTADFDAITLSHRDRFQLANEGSTCMLGEMYGMTTNYSSMRSDESCQTCEGFSMEIPESLGIGCYNSESTDDDITDGDKFLDVLDRFAIHIQEEHTNKMKKTLVPNEC